MALNLPPEHPLRIELSKWEKPYRYERFPAMVYMARQTSDGRWLVSDPHNEGFSASCQRTVRDEHELARAIDEGWRTHPKEAMEYRRRLEDAISEAAAMRAYEDRNMGEKAKAEAEKAEAESFAHMPEIPEKRRGRRPHKAA